MKKKEIEQLLKLAVEITENPLDSPYITDTEREKARYATDVLLPSINDLRARKIIWLRAKGLCWKVIQKNVNLSRWQARRLYNNGILEISQKDLFQKRTNQRPVSSQE